MSTTIGLIADVHAEIKSLTFALDILKGHGAQHIVCAGDLLEKGQDGDAVVQRIRERAIPCVQGNHDAAALYNRQWLRENRDHEVLKRHRWLLDEAGALDDATLDFASALPKTLRFEWHGVRVLVAHGTPWSYAHYVFATSRPAVFERIAREAGADTGIVVLGHTHTPMRVDCGDLLVLNPGSVCGLQSSGSHTCGLLTLPERTFKVLSLRTGQPAVIDDGLIQEW